MNNTASRIALRLAAILMAAMASLCCNRIWEGDEAKGPKQANLRIILDVPATKASTDEAPGFDYDNTNQHEGADNILVQNDLDFYFFTTDGEFVTMTDGHNNVWLTNSAYVNPYHRYLADLKVEGLQNGHIYRVVIIANKDNGFQREMPFRIGLRPSTKAPAGFNGTDEQYLYTQLEMDTYSRSSAHNTSIPEYTKWNLDGSPDATVPMWGVQTITARIKNTQDEAALVPSGEVFLLRSIAKVKLSFAQELFDIVKITNYISNDSNTGVVLRYSRDKGMMTPSYSNARAESTWDSANKDIDGAGKYTNANINAPGANVIESPSFAMPMYLDSDGGYYAYLPEQKIGEAWMSVQLEYLDANIPDKIRLNKKVQFANYTEATIKRDELNGSPLGDIPLTEEELKDFRFPVMRNHYYKFHVARIEPLEVKFEVCEWLERETEINFY